MPASPQQGAEGTVSLTVKSAGAAIRGSIAIISVAVTRSLNRVPTATLVLADGDMPEQTFPASDSDTFKPGQPITIEAGYEGNTTAIFSGIVIKHSLSIQGSNDARLVVECRDKAVAMTVGRRSEVHIDKTDSDVFSHLVGAYPGLSSTATATAVSHGHLVQHYCSDWDFMLARAEACGHVVSVVDGTVTIGPPQTDVAAGLTVGYGESLIEFQADVDARHQYTSVQAQSWNAATQAVELSTSAAPIALNAQGNLSSATLAEVASPAVFALQTGAPWAKPALDNWAKAQQLRSGLNRMRGRMSFQGSALAKVDGVIELKGVGERFSGMVYVTGLKHDIREGAWTTEVQFGQAIEWFAERTDLQSPPASGLVPGISGLHAGVVMKLDADPAAEHRVQVHVPSAGLTQGVWARLLQGHASQGFGAFFVPEVGDEVLLGWFNDDPGYPVILGSLYSSKHAPPHPLTAENHTKAIVTRSLCRIEIDDDKKIITISTPGKNSIVISDDAQAIELKDQHGNTVKLNSAGISLDSPKDIKLTAKGGISLDAVAAISLSSKADVSVKGLNISCQAQVGFTGKGSATAELSAAGQTTVKGALVMIN